MSLTDSPRITVTELPDAPIDATLQGILSAYTAEGYEQGYARGARDLLALYPLLIEQFLHTQSESNPHVTSAVRRFGQYVERQIGKKLDEAGYVEGGLGI